MKHPKPRSIDECPVRGCGHPVPGVDHTMVFEGADYVCSGPRRHRLAATVGRDGTAAWVNEGPTRPAPAGRKRGK